MAFPAVPILALFVAGAALKRRKATGKFLHKKSDAVIVIQGNTSKSIELEPGERLSIHFLETPQEEWKMVDAPDGFLMGSTKIEWAPAPGEKRLKTFDFSAKREGSTKAVFSKIVGGSSAASSTISITIERRLT